MASIARLILCLLAFGPAALLPAAARAADGAKVMVEPVPDDVWAAMQGLSWHATLADCPEATDCTCPPRESLVLLTVPYRAFDGTVRSGRMIVAKSVAGAVSGALQAIFDEGSFRFQEIELVDAYGGDDDRSMAANNTSAFNCRLAAGSTSLSAHARGTAIDINPVQNPYVKGDLTLPPSGTAFDEAAERTADIPGMIVPDGVVVAAFKSVGWKWGGEWKTLKDYQHFSADGH